MKRAYCPLTIFSAALLFVGLSLSCASSSSAPDGDVTEINEVTDELPVERLPELDEMNRGDLLEDIHPELQKRIRLMYALLKEEGIEIVFVSGYRPHSWFDKPNRLASWHNLGMAVDLNLRHRTSLDDATEHYSEDEHKWERIGEMAKGLGIIWGARYDDIFHFEWHPGYHARIREHEFEEFQALAGDDLDNHREVWSRFAPRFIHPDDPECFGGCIDVPDDGLRLLLEMLR